MKHWAVVVLLLAGCDLPGASTPETDVVVSEEDFHDYWVQLERRWPIYFTGHCRPVPVLPGPDAIYARVHFVEVPRAYLSTCTYSNGSGQIRVGDDKWQSGCVPHELGHAVCDYLDRPAGCDTFEHPDAVSRCE